MKSDKGSPTQMPPPIQGMIRGTPRQPYPRIQERDPERVDEPNRVDIVDERTNETVVKGSIIAMAFEETYADVTLHLNTGYVLQFTGETLLKIATRANTKAVIKRMKGK